MKHSKFISIMLTVITVILLTICSRIGHLLQKDGSSAIIPNTFVGIGEYLGIYTIGHDRLHQATDDEYYHLINIGTELRYLKVDLTNVDFGLGKGMPVMISNGVPTRMVASLSLPDRSRK